MLTSLQLLLKLCFLFCITQTSASAGQRSQRAKGASVPPGASVALHAIKLKPPNAESVIVSEHISFIFDNFT